MQTGKLVFIFLILSLSGCSTSGNTVLLQENESIQKDISLVECRGEAECFVAKVYSIVDGDTIKVIENEGGEPRTIRLALVNTPEKTERGFEQAKTFTEKMCPLLSEVIVDEDDGQQEGSYERMIGVVYCGGVNLNSELLNAEHAIIFADFCKKSEFGRDEWATKYGC